MEFTQRLKISVEKTQFCASCTPGTKPEALTVQGDWKAAVKKSLAKKKPPEGWPK
jgi:hypothetical protein